MNQEKKTEPIVTVRPVHSRAMSGDSEQLDKFDINDTASQTSGATTMKEVEAGRSTPKRYSVARITRWFGVPSSTNSVRGQEWFRWMLVTVFVLGFFGVIAAM
jgi:hypothetical protein